MRYLIKIALSDRVAIFWIMLFPLMLSTLFMFAFEGIKNKDNFTSIKVAFVEVENKESDSLYGLMDGLIYDVDGKEKKMFIVSEMSLEEGKKKLESRQIDGYIYQETLYIYQNGMKETIIKTVIENYNQAFDQATTLVNHTTLTYPEAYARIFKENNYFVYSGEKTSSLIESYYYAVLGMAIMIAATFSLLGTTYILPNQSSIGMRMAISPKSKFKLLALILLVNLMIMMIVFGGILLFFNYVVKIQFHHPLEIVLITFLGSLFALVLGFSENILLSKLSLNAKISINSLIGIVGGFLSGMMFQQMKYIIAQKAPFLNYINPVNLITDGFLSIEQYGNLNRFYLNALLLVIFSVVLMVLSLLKFRREKYESL